MTIREIITHGKLLKEVDHIYRFSAINIKFVRLDEEEDETQLDVSNNICTKAGVDELSELFESLTKELNTKKSNVLSCTVVGSAPTYKKFVEQF